MKRILKKLVSAVLSAAMLVGALGISGKDLIIVKADENDGVVYLNDKYVSYYNGDVYDVMFSHKDERILMTNCSKSSYAEKTNCMEQAELSVDSTLTYVGKDGINRTICNKDKNDKKKYDYVYGSLTSMIYDYTLVGKEGKVGFLNDNGQLEAINNTLLYDNVYIYTDEQEKNGFYGLCENNTDDTFKYTLVNDKGEIIFSFDNCTSIVNTRGVRRYKCDYLLFTFSNGTSALMGLDGKMWANGEIYEKYYDLIPYRGAEKGILIDYGDSFGIYDYDNGKTYEGKGAVKIESEKIVVTNNGETTYYNMHMDKLYRLDSTGEKYYIGENDSETAYSYIRKNVLDKIGVSDTEEILSENVVWYNAGLLFSYTIKGNKSGNYSVFVSKESNYKELEQLEGKYIYNGNTYIDADKTITKPDGTVLDCKYQLYMKYNFDGEKIARYDISSKKKLYSNTIWSFAGYGEDGCYYSVSNNGEIVEKIVSDTSQSIKKYKVGDKGTYYTKTEKYEIYKSDGSILNIGLDDLYDNSNISGISINNTFLYGWSYGNIADLGYIYLRYYNKTEKKYYITIYAYTGERVLEFQSNKYIYGNTFVDKNNRESIIKLSDGSMIQLKDICNNTLQAGVADSDMNIEISNNFDSQMLKGVSENVTVNELKTKLNSIDIVVKDKLGNELGNNTLVGTGCSIELLKDDEVIDAAVVVIKGDTDGTGTIDVLDMETMQKSILGIGDGLSGAYKEAALLTDGSNAVSVLDMEAVQKDILGIQKINSK